MSDQTKPASVEDDGFVVVGAPLPSVKDFAEWVQKQRMPSAKNVLSGNCQDDEISFLVDRKSFLRDALRSFETLAKQRRRSEAPSEAAFVPKGVGIEVTDDVWTELWSQFEKDAPRQDFQIQRKASIAEDDTQPSLNLKDASQLSQEVLGFLKDHSSVLADQVQKEKKCKESASSSSLSRWFWWGGATATNLTSESSIDDCLQHVLRLIILFSQQGVLALPLEIFNQEFCVGSDDALREWETEDLVEQASQLIHHRPKADDGMPQLFIGEIPEEHNDEVPSRAMQIVLRDGGGAAKDRVYLEVHKTLRVFSLVEMTDDYTLFFLDSTIRVDVFGKEDDPIEVKWTTTVCKNPLAVAQGRQARAKALQESEEALLIQQLRAQAEEEHRHELEKQSSLEKAGRTCQCLGASSGFHKTGCQYA